ncbi:nicotinate-nucleotide adenylyltransferase [Fontivita pretiosa]|uniref:nicotinate-nucleotide adenylyltransferase n=1 Tax=Fontivita pretiosa TaxID=2989684 RepID=UPI003D16DC22
MHKKTLCLGGSFNPIHLGHLICARAVAEARGFARVMLIPCGQPPHKPRAADLASPTHRLQMCRLAIQTSNSTDSRRAQVQFDISEIEIARRGPSYTIDTVRQLRSQGWTQVHWLIGADMLNYLPKWREPAALIREASLLIMARPGVPIDWNALPGEFASLKDNVVVAPLIEISSTQIRWRVRAGLSIEYLTPPAVVRYIHTHRLYLS